MTYKGVSLFSGCGGLDLGFERVDDFLNKKPEEKYFEIVWANDIDEDAVNTYVKNFKFNKYKNPDKRCSMETKNIYNGDIRKINFKDILNKKEIDFVLGGFPCQDFSILRGGEKRKGIKVKRGELYLQFVRALVELQPEFFVAENVKGLKSANNGLAFKQIKNDFQHLHENWLELRERMNVNYKLPESTGNYKLLFSKI
ncbi:MAG: DNA cytosine methyltransferase, partial [Candidatus Woesearchaeota archaeon]